MRKRRWRAARRSMSGLREAVFKLRGGAWTALFLLVLLFAKPTSPGALAAGLVLVALGRRSGSGRRLHLKISGRDCGCRTARDWGPTLVRNPLYTGNWLIGAGWGLIAAGGPCFCSRRPSGCCTARLSCLLRRVPFRGLRGRVRDVLGQDGRFLPRRMPEGLAGPSIRQSCGEARYIRSGHTPRPLSSCGASCDSLDAPPSHRRQSLKRGRSSLNSGVPDLPIRW